MDNQLQSISFSFMDSMDLDETVDGSEILHQLGCVKPLYIMGENYYISTNWCRMSEPSTVGYMVPNRVCFPYYRYIIGNVLFFLVCKLAFVKVFCFYVTQGTILGVPLTVYPWYLLCSPGILGDYNP